MRRFQLAIATVAVLCVAASASAQAGRAAGVVRDTNGRALRGAIVRAVSESQTASQITSTSDDKGRWAMIGLSSGTWRFTIEAEGFVTQTLTTPVRMSAPASLAVSLVRDLGPMPGALDRNVSQQVANANAMRDQGRLDQALEAYQEIRTKNPRLTAIGFAMADTYRLKAAQERNPTAREALLQQAIASYTDLLGDEATNERARLEIDSTRAEVSGSNGAPR